MIRPEHKEDYYQAELTIQRAFYNVYMPGCEEHLLLHELRDSKDYLPSLSFVFIQDGNIIGAIYGSVAILKCHDETFDVLTFGPLGVDPAFQNEQIGSALVNHFISEAKKANYPAIIITGVPEYYPRFGFKSCFLLNLKMEDGSQFPALMGLSLKNHFLETHPGFFSEASIFMKARTISELDEFDKKFPKIEKEVRPNQWKHLH